MKTLFRIPEAIALQNARMRESNKIKYANFPEVSLDTGCISALDLEKILHPKASPKTQCVNAYNLKKRQVISLDQLFVICHVLDTDPNFLSDFDSYHDDDYKRLIEDKQTK